MKRIQYHHYGGPGEMRLEEFEPASPGVGQIVVRVKAASVNKVDWFVRNGGLKIVTRWRFPRAMGTDFAGVVETVGPSVTRLKVGDDVFGTTPMRESGAFAEALVTNEKLAVVKPRGVPFDVAACLPVVAVTVWRALSEIAHLKRGQAIFVNGCLGNVGRGAIQLAKMLGASVAGSCRGSAIDEARALGVDPVVDFKGLDIEALKGRFDVVFDTPSVLSFKQGSTLIKRGGVVIGTEPTPATMFRSLFTRRYKLVIGKQTPEVLTKVADLTEAGHLQPKIGRVVPLSEAIPAIADLELKNRPDGKLVIVTS
jgi:NADPH:quinone reductase-like Zn-dependent oxidoreductase